MLMQMHVVVGMWNLPVSLQKRSFLAFFLHIGTIVQS
jgi:hypothetical protein